MNGLCNLDPPQTCRAFRNVISSSTSLRYKLALCKHGMCDGPRNGLSKAEKLGLLNAYVNARREINSAVPEEVESFEGLGYPLGISGNILVFYKPMSQNKVPGPHRELLICRVPSAIRRVELAQWLLTVPFGITDICIDASQNLLIYSLYASLGFLRCFSCLTLIFVSRGSRFHICSLSNGKVHPLAEHGGSFALHQDGRIGKDVTYSRICKDYVAARVDFGHISVWNWKTGEHISHKVGTFSRNLGYIEVWYLTR